MALKLNQEGEYRQVDEYKVPMFREFYGRNVDQMPVLVKAGRVPLSMAGVLQRRLNLRNGEADVQSAWMNNYIDTIDGIAYHPDGRIKVVLDSQTLRDMNAESPRNGGALVIGEDVYKALEGEEFKKGKLGKTGDWLTKAEVKDHAIWKILARDQALLNDAVDYTFEEYKQRFAKDTSIEDIRAMGVFPSECKGNAPEMRAFFVCRLERGSSVCGGFDLDFGCGRLVGLAPEAQVAKNLVAPRVQRYTIADVQLAVQERDKLAQMVKPDAMNGINSLLGKL